MMFGEGWNPSTAWCWNEKSPGFPRLSRWFFHGPISTENCSKVICRNKRQTRSGQNSDEKSRKCCLRVCVDCEGRELAAAVHTAEG
jgi:hypothetical protein